MLRSYFSSFANPFYSFEIRDGLTVGMVIMESKRTAMTNIEDFLASFSFNSALIFVHSGQNISLTGLILSLIVY